jgi:AcrR family transcriptional regulator
VARNRFDNLEPERRDAMLAAAADEFAERGYAGASLSRIIEAAGISKGSLYYYFNDKEDLFATTVKVAMRRLVEAAGGFDLAALTRETYWDALRAFGMRSAELYSRQEWFVRFGLAFARLRDEPEAGAAVRPALEWGRRITRDVLVRGQDLGTVRQDLPLDLLVEVTMAVDEAGDRWFAEHYEEYEAEDLRALVEARIDLMRDMLDAEHEGWDR